MIGKVRVNTTTKNNIAEIELCQGEYGAYSCIESKNIKNFFMEKEQTKTQGFIDVLDIDVCIDINENILKKMFDIKTEFGYQSGRWAENEYLQSDIAIEEFNYIHNQCNKNNFQYEIDWEVLKDCADEYDEELISLSDVICEENPFSKGYFINKHINDNNYWQFDALASDIEWQLINHLKKQLI